MFFVVFFKKFPRTATFLRCCSGGTRGKEKKWNSLRVNISEMSLCMITCRRNAQLLWSLFAHLLFLPFCCFFFGKVIMPSLGCRARHSLLLSLHEARQCMCPCPHPKDRGTFLTLPKDSALTLGRATWRHGVTWRSCLSWKANALTLKLAKSGVSLPSEYLHGRVSFHTTSAPSLTLLSGNMLTQELTKAKLCHFLPNKFLT